MKTKYQAHPLDPDPLMVWEDWDDAPRERRIIWWMDDHRVAFRRAVIALGIAAVMWFGFR